MADDTSDRYARKGVRVVPIADPPPDYKLPDLAAQALLRVFQAWQRSASIEEQS